METEIKQKNISPTGTTVYTCLYMKLALTRAASTFCVGGTACVFHPVTFAPAWAYSKIRTGPLGIRGRKTLVFEIAFPWEPENTQHAHYTSRALRRIGHQACFSSLEKIYRGENNSSWTRDDRFVAFFSWLTLFASNESKKKCGFNLHVQVYLLSLPSSLL